MSKITREDRERIRETLPTRSPELIAQTLPHLNTKISMFKAQIKDHQDQIAFHQKDIETMKSIVDTLEKTAEADATHVLIQSEFEKGIALAAARKLDDMGAEITEDGDIEHT